MNASGIVGLRSLSKFSESTLGNNFSPDEVQNVGIDRDTILTMPESKRPTRFLLRVLSYCVYSGMGHVRYIYVALGSELWVADPP